MYFPFFSLDDLKMSLFLYKLGIKLLQVSDVQWDLHSVDYNVCVCVLCCVFENHKNLCKFGVVGSNVLTFCFRDGFTIFPSRLEFLRSLYPKRVLSDFKGVFPNDLCCPEVADANNFSPKDTGMQRR